MFSLNSFFSRKMTKLFDLCWLNVLCLVTCIPIINNRTGLYGAVYGFAGHEQRSGSTCDKNVFQSVLRKISKKGVGCRPDLYSHYGAAHFRYSNLAGFADGDKASVCDSNCYFNCPAGLCWAAGCFRCWRNLIIRSKICLKMPPSLPLNIFLSVWQWALWLSVMLSLCWNGFLI